MDVGGKDVGGEEEPLEDKGGKGIGKDEAGKGIGKDKGAKPAQPSLAAEDGPGLCKVCAHPLQRKGQVPCGACWVRVHARCLVKCEYASPCGIRFCPAHAWRHQGHEGQ